MRIRALGCAVLALLACGREDAPRDVDVAVDVRFVTLDPVSNSPVIVLEEHGGERRLPIWIGLPEAQSIAQHLEAVEPPRPNTHDLAKRLVQGLDGAIERVTVTELREGTYYAVIALRSNGKPVEIDARPSDAIALALRMAAPVFVRAPLFDARDLEPGEREAPGERTHAPAQPAGSRAATARLVPGIPTGKRIAAASASGLRA
jgi:bifunctional DNase/RNase